MAKKRTTSRPTLKQQPNLMQRLMPYAHLLPWAVAGVYLAVMAYLVFRNHRIGGFGVETDFYAELVPQSRALLRGEFDPTLYGNKGPVYSILLAGVYLVVREYFTAGLVLNLAGAGVSLMAGYYLVREVFNTPSAAFFVIACAANHTFQTYTFQAGSDMPFLALGTLALLFLFRAQGDKSGIRNLTLSAVFACMAFLCRYNGIYLAASAGIWLAIAPGLTLRRRMKRLGLWFGVFILAGLPWYIPNTIATGNPVHNDNHVNVMMEFYGRITDRDSYESWVDRVPDGIESLGDVVRYDPPRFFTRYTINLVAHLVFDGVRLIGLPVAVLVLIGIILLPFARPSRRILAHLAGGAALYAILALIFYNERFGLPLLAVYLPLAAWPLTAGPVASRIARIRIPVATVYLMVVAAFGVYGFLDVHHAIVDPRPQLPGLKALGVALSARVTDPHDRLAAREPHVAHYAGLTPRMFPENLRTPAELVAYCHQNGIRYVAYTAIEHSSRPYLRVLLENPDIPGLTPVVWNDIGVVFEVE